MQVKRLLSISLTAVSLASAGLTDWGAGSAEAVMGASTNAPSVSVSEEMRLGTQTHALWEGNLPMLPPDNPIALRVAGLVQSLARCCDRPQLSYHAYVIVYQTPLPYNFAAAYSQNTPGITYIDPAYTRNDPLSLSFLVGHELYHAYNPHTYNTYDDYWMRPLPYQQSERMWATAQRMLLQDSSRQLDFITQQMGRLVIMLTGADAVQTRLLEEVLTLQLLKQGLEVVSRLQVERLLAEQLVKKPPTGEKDTRKAIHATSVAVDAKATALVVGTINNETRVPPGRTGERSQTARFVKTVSLQLVGVPGENILWATCQEFDEAVSYNAMAEQLASAMGKD